MGEGQILDIFIGVDWGFFVDQDLIEAMKSFNRNYKEISRRNISQDEVEFVGDLRKIHSKIFELKTQVYEKQEDIRVISLYIAFILISILY